MKVSELIVELQKLNQDLPVYFTDWGWMSERSVSKAYEACSPDNFDGSIKDDLDSSETATDWDEQKFDRPYDANCVILRDM